MLILKFHPGMKCLHVFFSFFHPGMKFHPCLSSRDETSSRQKRVSSKRHFTIDRDDFIPGRNFTCKHPLLSILIMLQLIFDSQYRSSRPEVFLSKDVLKICSKFKGEHPCRSVISIKLQCNFIEIALRHGLLKLHFGMGVLL